MEQNFRSAVRGAEGGGTWEICATSLGLWASQVEEGQRVNAIVNAWTPEDSRELWLQLGPRTLPGPIWALYLDPDLG